MIVPYGLSKLWLSCVKLNFMPSFVYGLHQRRMLHGLLSLGYNAMGSRLADFHFNLCHKLVFMVSYAL